MHERKIETKRKFTEKNTHTFINASFNVSVIKIAFGNRSSMFFFSLLFTIADKCKLVKGPKPLTHFKFYLDIEKHHIENKIEKTIRELGGVSKRFYVFRIFVASKFLYFFFHKRKQSKDTHTNGLFMFYSFSLSNFSWRRQ